MNQGIRLWWRAYCKKFIDNGPRTINGSWYWVIAAVNPVPPPEMPTLTPALLEALPAALDYIDKLEPAHEVLQRAYSFFCGVQFTDHPIEEQREIREILAAMGKALEMGKEK